MVKTKAVTQIRLDETVYTKLKYIAEKELRSLNAQMEYFIIQGIEEFEKKNGSIPTDQEE